MLLRILKSVKKRRKMQARDSIALHQPTENILVSGGVLGTRSVWFVEGGGQQSLVCACPLQASRERAKLHGNIEQVAGSAHVEPT